MDFAAARQMMVDGQLRINDMTDPDLVAAFEAVPRERFVPPDKASLAYFDFDLPVLPARDGRAARRLLKPLVIAKLIDIAKVGPTDRVLDVGCATGYSSAVLARLAHTVVALEEEVELAERARANLAELNLGNVSVHVGTLTAGWVADAPYDVILLNGAVETVPDALAPQLNQSGRLACVFRNGPAGKGMLYRASGGTLSGRSVFDAAAPLLPGFAAPPAFVF